MKLNLSNSPANQSGAVFGPMNFWSNRKTHLRLRSRWSWRVNSVGEASSTQGFARPDSAAEPHGALNPLPG